MRMIHSYMCVVIGALLIEYKNVNITYSKGYRLEGHDTTWVNLECRANWLATKSQHKKWIVGGKGTETGEQLSFTSGELALNYRVNQECSCKEEKGLTTLDYW